MFLIKNLFVLLSLLVICVFSGTEAQSFWRLDPNVIPELYSIRIKPYLFPEDGDNRFLIDGEVNITLHSTIPLIDEIVLHKDYMTVQRATLYNDANSAIETFNEIDFVYDSSTDQLTVPLNNPLTANKNYTLAIKYVGQVRTGNAGLFSVNYSNSKGEDRWLAVTQLQRIDARTLLPCFDEPQLKAKFQMQISRPKNYTAFFNTKLIKSEPDGENRMLDYFEETPKMSTYLLAVMIADFVTRGDDNLIFITRRKYLNYTDFSYSAAQKVLKFYNEYTKLPYEELGNPLMQKAASPSFPHNGMENWGLVIYKDPILILEPGYTDGWADKEFSIAIIVHETAHMWFGNSVTFAWWSYFWLNEGFARYYQYFISHELYPEYHLDQQFVVNQVQLIFGTDATNTTQPLTSPETDIETPSQISYKFSGITYAKGACIIRMIRNLMGYENFDNAIHDYLKANHLKNTIPADLFLHLKNHWPAKDNVDLDVFFHDWTEQVGYPTLFVNVSEANKEVTLTQKRFLMEPSGGSNASIRYTIPITYTTDIENEFDNLTAILYFNKTSENVVIRPTHQFKWIIFNVQQSNYYRVFYDKTILKEIGNALSKIDHSGIHVATRSQIIDDLFNFALVGLLEYDVVFEFLEYLYYEFDYIPWASAFNGLNQVAKRIPLDRQKDFVTFLKDVTGNIYEHLHFEDEDDTILDVYNRNNVIAWLCKFNINDCTNKSMEIFLKSQADNVKPSPDFRETLYCAANRFSKLEFYENILKWYSEETRPSERELLVRALGCTNHHNEIHFKNILSDKIPRGHKKITLASLYTQNPDQVTPVFYLIINDIDALHDALGDWIQVASVISDIADYFTTLDQLDLLENTVEIEGHKFGSYKYMLDDAVTKVKRNLEWAEKQLPPLYHYLNTRNFGIRNLIEPLMVFLSLLPLIIIPWLRSKLEL